jgi:hypothetical protein
VRRACLAALLFVVIDAAFLPTVAARPVSPPAAVTAPSTTATASLFAFSTGLGRVMSFFENTFNDRRRMIQLAALGMCIGLYILMRR